MLQVIFSLFVGVSGILCLALAFFTWAASGIGGCYCRRCQGLYELRMEEKLETLTADLDSLALAYADIQVDRDKLQTELFNDRQERDALAAQIELLQQASQRYSDGQILRYEFVRGLQFIAAATPQQCLAKIRAEAGRDGYMAAVEVYAPHGDAFAELLADEYAQSVRQGGAK